MRTEVIRKVSPRYMFTKGELYTHKITGSILICTDSSNEVLSGTYIYHGGKFGSFVGTHFKYLPATNFEPFKGELKLISE